MPVSQIVRLIAAEEPWRKRLEEAQRRHAEQETDQTRAEFRRVLCIFADLVLHHKLPPPD